MATAAVGVTQAAPWRLAPAWFLAAALSVLALACSEPATDLTDSATQPVLRRETIVLVACAEEGMPALVVDEVLQVSLERNRDWRRPVELDGAGRYSVILRFDGLAPRLLSGTLGQASVRPLRVVSSEPGRLEATWKPTAGDAVLVVRALGGSVTLTELTIRRWASARAGTRSSVQAAEVAARSEKKASEVAPVPQRLEIGRLSRLGWVLPSSGELVLPVDLPLNATSLVLAQAQGSGAPGSRGGSAPSLMPLSVHWRDETGREQLLAELDATATRDRWQESFLDVGALAGQRGAIVLSLGGAQPPVSDGVDGRTGAGVRDDLDLEVDLNLDVDQGRRPRLVSVPELLCESGARRPNLVLVSLDTTRPDHLSLYGNPRKTTPHLDEFSQSAVVFDEALSVSAYTLPSHATMLSGLHPLGHGVVHPGNALDSESLPLIAKVLQQRGWATGAFTGGGYLSADFGFAAGFSSYGQTDPLRGLIAHDRELLYKRFGGQAALDAVDSQNWDAALSWIRARQQLPFFVFLQTFAIHDYRSMGEQRGLFGGPPQEASVDVLRPFATQLAQPYSPSERGQLDALYDEAIVGADEQLGRLFVLLDELSLRDNTVVVITGDHGETFGEHGYDGVDVVGHNFGLWHEQVAVPLVIAAPGLAAARRQERVSLLDLAPTMLDLLDVPIPEAMQGRSLVGWLGGDREAQQPSPALLDLASNEAQQRAFYSGRFKVLVGDPLARVTAPVSTAQALFDLRADPTEQRNLAGEFPDVLARIMGEMTALEVWLEASGAGPAEAELDEQTLRQLQELGYLER
ncbi:MAG: arylsulfatase A-like enzyme [Pseudohongiellaceae bacterium]